MAHETDKLITQIKVGSTTYDIHDAQALHSIEDLQLATVLTFAGSDTSTNILAKTSAKKGEVWLATDNGKEYVCKETFSGAADSTKWETLGAVHAHTHSVGRGDAAPHTHTHTVTVSGTTGTNSGTAVSAVTGYNSFSGGSGSLTSVETQGTGDVPYVESITHTPCSLGGTKTFVSSAIKSSKNVESSTSTDGPQYVKSISYTAPTLGGTTSFNTDAIKSASASASSTSTDGPIYVESITPCSGGLSINDSDATGRIGVVTGVTHTAASLTGTKTFVTGVTQGSGGLTSVSTKGTGDIQYVESHGAFSAGTTPPASATPTHTSTNTGGASASVTASVATVDGSMLVLTNVSAAKNSHTHTYDKTTGVTLNAGTPPSLGNAVVKYLHHTHTPSSSAGTASVGISGGGVTVTTKYLEHTHTPCTVTSKYMKITTAAASKSAVTINGGSCTPTTRYMKDETAAASTASVSLTGGSIDVVTKYLHHTHTGAALGSPTTKGVAPKDHAHSYGSSTALTTSVNSGSAVKAVTSVGQPA